MLKKYTKFMLTNHLFTVLSIFFIIIYCISASRLPEEALLFPKVILSLLALVCLWNIIESILEFRKLNKSETGEEATDGVLGLNLQKVAVYAVTCIYVVLVSVLGFGLSTIIYLAFLSYYLGVRDIKRIVLYVLVLFCSIYGVFVQWLDLVFPKSLLF